MTPPIYMLSQAQSTQVRCLRYYTNKYYPKTLNAVESVILALTDIRFVYPSCDCS